MKLDFLDFTNYYSYNYYIGCKGCFTGNFPDEMSLEQNKEGDMMKFRK